MAEVKHLARGKKPPKTANSVIVHVKERGSAQIKSSNRAITVIHVLKMDADALTPKVQVLARELAPRRVNAIASDSAASIDAALAYLNAADGVTGQYLQLDDAGAGPVVSPPA